LVAPLAVLLASCTTTPSPQPAPRVAAPSVAVALTPAPNIAGDPNAGRRLFPTKCATCHTIPGIAYGIIPQAPNLNNVSVKPRLADAIDTTPDNMKRWILSPQTVKQGTLMVTQVTDAEAQDLTAFLYSLPYNPSR
jgi:cytochrome c2